MLFGSAERDHQPYGVPIRCDADQRQAAGGVRFGKLIFAVSIRSFSHGSFQTFLNPINIYLCVCIHIYIYNNFTIYHLAGLEGCTWLGRKDGTQVHFNRRPERYQ